MRDKILSIFFFAIFSLLVTHCGGFKVTADVDDSDLEKIEDAFSQGDRDSSNTSNDSTETSDANDSDSNTDTSGLTGDPNDPDGGIEPLQKTQKSSNRYFMGTYTKNSYETTCDDSWYGGYYVPTNVRVYSNNAEVLDFEDNEQELLWQALVYPDDTFDFSVQYLDSFGDPSIKLTCTCEIQEFSYYSDEMDCACEATNGDSCDIVYNKKE